nr:hypothetical protein [Phytohabitans suffuscus]
MRERSASGASAATTVERIEPSTTLALDWIAWLSSATPWAGWLPVSLNSISILESPRKFVLLISSSATF